MRLSTITYADGRPVSLGDLVMIRMSDGPARARVVMLGDTGEHLEIDPGFLRWVRRDRVLERSQVVVEWVDRNPLAHGDPACAPIGDYMFTHVDECVARMDASPAAAAARRRGRVE